MLLFGGLVLQGGARGAWSRPPLPLLVKLPHRMKFFYERSDSWKDSKKYPNRPAPDKVARSGAAKQKNDEYSGHASTRLEEKSEKFHYMNKLEQFIHIYSSVLIICIYTIYIVVP